MKKESKHIGMISKTAPIELEGFLKREFTDKINPKHYKDHPSGVECIDVTRHMSFNIGNAVKYLWRHGNKPNEDSVTDLKKAIWYIEDEIKRIRTKQEK